VRGKGIQSGGEGEKASWLKAEKENQKGGQALGAGTKRRGSLDEKRGEGNRGPSKDEKEKTYLNI